MNSMNSFNLMSVLVHSATGSLFTTLWRRAWELSVNYFVNKSTRGNRLQAVLLLKFDPQF